ncbi:hypothetical protein KIPB_005027, partial [Kipferlia bialata]|eukprot:g2448.t1
MLEGDVPRACMAVQTHLYQAPSPVKGILGVVYDGTRFLPLRPDHRLVALNMPHAAQPVSLDFPWQDASVTEVPFVVGNPNTQGEREREREDRGQG